MRLRIAARRSALAQLQARSVGERLAQAHPGLAVEYEFRESLGDRNQSDPLWKMPAQGVFTEDFQDGLVRGEFDLVVHSWKDLPVQTRTGTAVVATLPREDARDLLLLPKVNFNYLQRSRRLRVLSSSPRRAYNAGRFLVSALPVDNLSVEFLPVRGNMSTRIRKLFAGEGDALLLAKAAVDRLLAGGEAEIRDWINKSYWMVLPLSANPTAAAQGALAMEVARNRPEVAKLLAAVQCGATFAAAEEEREVLARYGGGCHQKIGVTVLPRPYGKVLSLRGLSEAGDELATFTILRSERLAKVERQAAWPLSLAEAQLFARERVAASNPAAPLWVAKAEALPADWKISPEQIVWVSGVKSWQALAKRGVWVHGCADGLGEGEEQRLEELAPGLQWRKLSHSAAPASPIPLLPTYQLQLRSPFPNLNGKTHFFWPSSSLFEAALAAFPEIRAQNHACGPGNTLHRLREILGRDTKIAVFLSHEDWLKEIL